MGAAEGWWDDDEWDDTLPDDEPFWNPEPAIGEEEPIFLEQLAEAAQRDLPALKPSQFTEHAFWMPKTEKHLSLDGKEEFERVVMDRFSFEGRRHMIRPYDTPARKLLLFCGRQVEKCCDVDTLVSMADGSQKRAGDVRVGDRVIGLHGSSTLAPSSVTWVSRLLTKQSFEVVTRQGHKTVVAGTHPVRTWDSWTPAAQLRGGSRVAVVRQAGDFARRSPITSQHVALCAYFVADGGVGSGYAAFTQRAGAVLDDFLSQLRGTYQADTREYARNGAVSVRLSRCPGVRKMLESDGLWGKLSGEKTLPSWAFALTHDKTALLLNRLWACDGHVKKNTRSKYSLEYCSTSPVLVRQIQTLLWKFGIPSRIRENRPSVYKARGEKKLAYILRVETARGAYMFLSRIGALGKSESVPLPDLRVPTRSNRDTLPPESRRLFEQAIPPGRSLRSLGIERLPRAGVTLDRLRTWIDVLRAAGGDVSALEEWITPDVFWDEVVAVTPVGSRTCVDFEVEGAHSFICDGVVTHNSTLLGNIMLSYMCLVAGYRALYVSPSMTQTKTFSADRVREPMETSPVLQRFTTTMLSQNILEKQLVNRSKLTMRYAYLNADRTRGIPAYLLAIDEFQDILLDNVPVMEQCLSHAPQSFKRQIYSGTPKSLDNNLEYFRANLSTQGEWVIPCDACNFWNVLGEKNIGKHFLACEKCARQLNPMHERAQWANMVMDAPWESYRIPQLMVPWLDWKKDILYNYENYPREKFYNEVLGLSYDSGLRPLTTTQLKDHCHDHISMQDLEKYHVLSKTQHVYAGLDWGCHDEETRILTRGRGWQRFRDLADDDEVAQWDAGTRVMSFVKPKVRTVRDWDGEMLHFKTKGGLDMLLTGTHRMRVGVEQGSRWLTEPADSLVSRGGNVTFAGHVSWEGVEQETFTLPACPPGLGYLGEPALDFPMDKWLQLLGYFLSEGGLCFDKGRPSCVKMSQREHINPQTTASMCALLKQSGFKFSTFPNAGTGDVNWTIYGKRLWSWWRSNIGQRGGTKRIPREFLGLSSRQLRILLDALMEGDGTWDSREGTTGGSYSSTSRGLCEDVQELAIRLGYRAVVRQHKEPQGNKKAQWRCSVSRGRDFTFNKPSSRVARVPYKGKVYCCAVPTGYIVTERNGCVAYQGNTGEHSYTVLTLGTYVDMKFRVFYSHRFTGEDVDPEIQLPRILEMLRYFNVRYIGSDYGGGFHSNYKLLKEFGARKVKQFQYLARGAQKVQYNPKLKRYTVARTEVMSDVFNAIKRGKLEFPKWEEWKEPSGQDMLNIYSEQNDQLGMIQYKHGVDKPDDTFHTILYCLLASMFDYPRPDIMSADVEDQHGRRAQQWPGPIDQG